MQVQDTSDRPRRRGRPRKVAVQAPIAPNKPKGATMRRLHADRRVEHADDERANGNGVIVTLREGWSFEPGQDQRVRGEDTVTAALASLRWAKRFAGPFTP